MADNSQSGGNDIGLIPPFNVGDTTMADLFEPIPPTNIEPLPNSYPAYVVPPLTIPAVTTAAGTTVLEPDMLYCELISDCGCNTPYGNTQDMINGLIDIIQSVSNAEYKIINKLAEKINTVINEVNNFQTTWFFTLNTKIEYIWESLNQDFAYLYNNILTQLQPITTNYQLDVTTPITNEFNPSLLINNQVVVPTTTTNPTAPTNEQPKITVNVPKDAIKIEVSPCPTTEQPKPKDGEVTTDDSDCATGGDLYTFITDKGAKCFGDYVDKLKLSVPAEFDYSTFEQVKELIKPKPLAPVSGGNQQHEIITFAKLNGLTE